MDVNVLPQVQTRSSVIWRIILPFVILALVFLLGAVLLIGRLLSETSEDRFLRQLADSQQQANNAVVRVEEDLLEIERLVSNTEGVSDATVISDAESLRARLLPLAVNADADTIVILDRQGISLLTVRRLPSQPPGTYETLRGEAFYSSWPVVGRVLDGQSNSEIGDKHAGLLSVELEGNTEYIFFIGAPIFDSSGNQAGVVLVGEYANDLVAQVANESGGNVSLYSLNDGQLITTTLDPVANDVGGLSRESVAAALSIEPEAGSIRRIGTTDVPYREALSPLQVRQGSELIGILGVSLLDLVAISAEPGLPLQTRETIVIVASLAVATFFLILLFAYLISKSITRPLSGLVEASNAVAKGNLEIQVDEGGDDEVGTLTKSFNLMVTNLKLNASRPAIQPHAFPMEDEATSAGFDDQEGDTVPIVDLQSGRGVVFVAEMHFNEISDTSGSFADWVTILQTHGGAVMRMGPNEIMACFGLFPKNLPMRVAAYQATHAAIEAMEATVEGGQSTQNGANRVGIALASGEIEYGQMGRKDRLNPIVFGDTVELANQLLELVSELPEGGLLLSNDIFEALAATQDQFDIAAFGEVDLQGVDGKSKVYLARGRSTRLISSASEETTIK